MEHKKSNHSWDEEEIKKYLEHSAEAEEIPPELETENMRKYIKTQTTGEQQKKYKNITGNIKHWYPAVTAACLCIILLTGVSGITRKAGTDQQTYGTKLQTKDTAAHTTYHNIYQQFSKLWQGEYVQGEVQEYAIGTLDTADMARTTAGNEESSDAVRGETKKESSDQTEHGVTNTQEKNVDEGDVIKNDGRYLYQVISEETKTATSRNYAIQITDTQNGLKRKSKIRGFESISDFYIWKDRLIVIESCELNNSDTGATEDIALLNKQMYTGTAYCKIHIYDTKNRNKPKKIHTFTVKGSYEDSRISDGYFYFFAQNMTQKPDKEENYEEYIPVVDGKLLSEKDIFLPEECLSTSYLVMASIDLKQPEKFQDTKAVVTGAERFYVSEKNIYVTDSSYPDWEEAGTQSDSTKISRISYRDGKMELEASGSVEGVLTDDMAMSEYQGNLRIATTKTAYGIEKVTDDIDGEIIGYDTQESTTCNQLYILGKNLKIKGKIENLAKGEEIYAVRFLGNTGYVVTFRQTDPLFSIDLSDPKKPKVLGKLKISGFSEYLHGYGKGLLLGLGMEADEKDGAVEGMKLSMFDISDPSDVKETAKEDLTEYRYAEALYDYKEVLADQEKNLIGFLANGYDKTDKYRCDYLLYSYENGKFVQRMKMDCKEKGNVVGYIRGTYIGDSFYLLYEDGMVQKYSLDNGELAETLEQ